MTDISAAAAARLAELRRDFDQVYAAPYAARGQEEMESLIALRIENDLYGLSVREITGVAMASRLVPLPSRSPGLLGLTGIRGAVIPVYSLALLLGYPKAGDTVHWLALCGTKEPLALSLGAFEGYLRVPKTALHAPDRDTRQHVHRFAQAGDCVRAIISIESILACIQGSSGQSAPYPMGGSS